MRSALAFPPRQELRDGLRILVCLMAFSAGGIYLGAAEQDVRLGGGLLIVHVVAGDAVAVRAGDALRKVN